MFRIYGVDILVIVVRSLKRVFLLGYEKIFPAGGASASNDEMALVFGFLGGLYNLWVDSTATIRAINAE
jgi:hypothetical protein